ncbi:hypothetical protein KCU99_g3298, partial [Aureobasidium melanogenum]
MLARVNRRHDVVKIPSPVKCVARRSSSARVPSHVRTAYQEDSSVNHPILRNGLQISRSSSAAVSAAASDSSVLARVLERLQRLEDIVLHESDKTIRNKVSEEVANNFIPTLHEDVVQNEIFHTIGRSNASPQANIEQQEDEFRDTEIIGSRPTDTTNKEASFLFTSGKVSEITFDLDLRMPVLTSVYVDGSRVVRRICLPEREEARILFHTFAKSLGSWYHIYHRRTVEIILDKTYYQIACGHNPGLPQVALLLSIFASGAYFQASISWPECVFSDPRMANQLSMNWKQNTLEILDHIERSTTPTTVEQVQATIIMSLMIQNFEGLSKKYWLLHSASVTLAKDLSIHVLDHPRRAKSNDVVENEVKRRIWWYLATTDWLLGSMPSPQEGTYSINPRHTHVNKPMNVDDDDLLGENIIDKPLSIPTEMSYFLVRTHGGEVCRVLADLVHPLASGVNSVDYEEIVALERTTATITEKMPFYFQLDEESRKKTEPYLSKYPQKSLEIRRLLNQEKRGAVLPIARLNFVLYHIFMAALTLALDLCFNKSATEAEDRVRRAELKEACLMLQESKTEMPAADRFLTPLMELLRKHKIQLQDAGVQNQYLTPPESTVTPGIHATSTGNSCSSQSIAAQAQNVSGHNSVLAANPDMDFDGLWQEFINMVPDSSAPGWNDLLADFDQASLFIGV